MQEDRKGIAKLGCNRRVYNTSISDVVGSTTGSSNEPRNETLIALGDTTHIQRLLKKQIVARRSSVPSQSSLDIQKKADINAKEIEFDLLYDEYLQVMMMDLIIKKKTEEKRNSMVMQMAAMTQELDLDMKKLIKIKTRENDIINLSIAQKEIDAELIAVMKCTKDEMLNTVKSILSKLHSLLEPLNVLQCNGIILPKTQDEWKETQKILTSCSGILKNITDLIGSKGEIYCFVKNELKNFEETYNELENLQKKLQGTLCSLQLLVLKDIALLSVNESTMKVDE